MIHVRHRRGARLSFWLGLATLAWTSAGYAAAPEDEPTTQDRFWSHVKDMRVGLVSFDFGGQTRLRYEYDDGFTIKGYEPGGHDQLLLERVRLDLSARFWERPRLFLQLQDAHPFLTRLGESDFPQSSPIEDMIDIRQLYVEWLRIGGGPPRPGSIARPTRARPGKQFPGSPSR